MIAVLSLLGKMEKCKTKLFNTFDTRGHDMRRLFNILGFFKDYNRNAKLLEISEIGKELYQLINNEEEFNKKLHLILFNNVPHYNELNNIALLKKKEVISEDDLFKELRGRLLKINYDLSKPTFNTIKTFALRIGLIDIKKGSVTFNPVTEISLEDIQNIIKKLKLEYVIERKFDDEYQKCRTSDFIEFIIEHFPQNFKLTRADCYSILKEHKKELKIKFEMGVGDALIPGIRGIINFREGN